MKRYFIYLAYNGENYNGWQIQPNAPSVQETIEKGLSTILRYPVSIVGAGRTDAGVHARQMFAHFDVEEIENVHQLVFKLNRILPKDIVIYNIMRVKADAHARFDATSRLYRYYVTTAKDPFLHHLKYKIHGNIDMDAMNACANVLFDYIDFTSFSKLHTDVKTNNCEIMQAEWQRQGNDYIFTIKADRFLRNMVRSIVGTLLEAGRGKITPDDFRKIIEAKDRGAAGTSVPGHALFLEEVEYDNDIFIKE
ncbi:tRNA pseudouridine38-40 synthase [Dysgonomonas sp. PFB1-18]|uniref:tRNA pseudouridine(38-40) synthase TruA n=1 Tax=unclassified Dysgonomonas TaxID=2630389 RepID=UPI0024767CA5|nr:MULTISPECIES: tRNA pseudouridine(38-40) synthase TruA [unclassified Dysgonomonas]MDH6307226.1 tRNA pseudouridine38-40 synthase [Dysgonomonas sp. PF1-14]MDH6337144.1 tRNA pseudouridine38-40 synthase [Dysgonomonas sp. PF1-16]MDH6381130.1 tRNA pseudouridine38-40 synthase [Dysgonomonas sp. PFB1-18]MDH6396290.1 tRNA pseudouridine38-40 synthase [Dysgonomonas sp. PF1-23]